MLDRSELTGPEVKSLCSDLEKIAEDRNVVAHNPVFLSADLHDSKILDLANSADVFSEAKEFTDADIEALRKRTSDALEKLFDLTQKITRS